MKNKTSLILLLFIFSLYSYSQNKKMVNKDNILNSEMMKSGKFIQENKHLRATQGYYMVIKDSLRIEYSENGKYYTKSKITFLEHNKFNSIAFESTIPGFNHNSKEVVEVIILETSKKENLVKIKERANKGKWTEFLLRKVED